MSNIPSFLPVAQQPAGTAPSHAVIPTPPTGLTRLSAGALVEGTVIGRNQQGLLTVKTSHGELALRTAASPPPQSRVVLQLQPTGGQFRVILLSSEATRPAQGASAQKTPGGQQSGSQTSTAASQTRTGSAPVGTAPLAQARTSGQVQTPVQAGSSSVGSPASPNSQAQGVRQLGVPPPTQGQAVAGQQAGQAASLPGRPAAPPATLSTPAVLSAQASAPAPGPATGAPAPQSGTAIPPGTGLAGTPASATPASIAAPAGTPTPTSPAVSANSIANPVSPSSPALPSAPPTPIGVQAGQTPLPSGAAAVGNAPVLPGAVPSGAGPSLAGIATTLPAAAPASAALGSADLIRNWPGLDQAIATLRAASPQLAAPNIDAVMPRPGPQLAGSLALLISALRGGDIRGWLGQGTMRELTRASGNEAANRLTDEFGQLSRLTRTDSGEWRVQSLPFFDGSRHQQIQLYIKRRGQDASGGEDTPSRFVFEFDLSKLGPVQLDGLAAYRRFDLVVRSQEDLPEAIRKEIIGMFSRSQEESGFAGEIHFQTVPTFDVSPLGEVQPEDGGLVV